MKTDMEGRRESEKQTAGVAIGHPKFLGRFCFPPESLRPDSMYASFAKLQGRQPRMNTDFRAGERQEKAGMDSRNLKGTNAAFRTDVGLVKRKP